MSAFSARLVKALSRVTSSGDFIPEIDGLRFVAIFSVVFFHVELILFENAKVADGAYDPNSILLRFIRCGFIGVPLFFAISGFILALPFAAHHLEQRPKPNLRRYLLRRLTRLEPPYILCLTACLVFALAAKHAEFWETIKHYIAGLLYLHNILYLEPNVLNSPAWSLEIEVQFYLLAPLLTCVFAIRPIHLRRCAIVASALIIPWLASFVHYPARTLLQYLDWFLIGFLLADLYLVEWRRKPRLTWKWDLIGTGSALALVWLQMTWPNSKVQLLAVLLFYVGVFRGGVLNRLFTLPYIAVMGGMCYTIYLWHSRLLGRMVNPLKEWQIQDHYLLKLFCVAFPMIGIMLVLSSVLFYYTEKPFMYRDWPQKARLFFQKWIWSADRRVRQTELEKERINET